MRGVASGGRHAEFCAAFHRPRAKELDAKRRPPFEHPSLSLRDQPFVSQRFCLRHQREQRCLEEGAGDRRLQQVTTRKGRRSIRWARSCMSSMVARGLVVATPFPPTSSTRRVVPCRRCKARRLQRAPSHPKWRSIRPASSPTWPITFPTIFPHTPSTRAAVP